MKTILLSASFTLLCLNGLLSQNFHTKQATLPDLDKKFTVVAHIARDTFGEVNITEEEILISLDSANRFFKPIGVSFEICEFRIIDNFQYDAPANLAEWEEMKIKHHKSNRVNLFFVTLVNFRSRECGFTDVGAVANPDGGGIMVVKSCVDSTGKAIAHELGHFMGLFDTALNPEEELVDGSNCETAGDQICDTPADPYKIDSELRDYLNIIRCRFIYEGLDSNGQFFVPDVGNLMSDYPNHCRCGFSWEQLNRMAEAYIQAPRKIW